MRFRRTLRYLNTIMVVPSSVSLTTSGACLCLLGQRPCGVLAGACHSHLGELRADSVRGGNLVVGLLGEGGLEGCLVGDQQFGGEEVGFFLFRLVE